MFVSGKCLYVTLAILTKSTEFLLAASTEERTWYRKVLSMGGVASFYKTLHIAWDDYFHDYIKQVNTYNDTYYLPRELCCSNKTLHFANTSATNSIAAVDHTLPGCPKLFTDTERRVHVALKTRKPVRKEEEIDINLPQLKTPTSPVRYNLPTKSPAIIDYCLHHRVRNKDIDENGHATFTTYIALFMKCVNGALREGKFKWLQNSRMNIEMVYMDEFLVVYNKESHLGDNMSAVIWGEITRSGADPPETSSEPNKLSTVVYCHVERDDILLALCKLVFHTGNTANNQAKL